MNCSTMSDRQSHILIATPLGKGGMGGIDRIMDEVRAIDERNPQKGVSLSFGVTRGQGSIVLSPLYLCMFLIRMLSLKAFGRVDVLHINLSSHGSARRKMIVARCASLLKIPYVIHLHGSRFRQFWNESPPSIAHGISRMFKDAARIVVLGNVWKSFVSGKVPGIEDKVVIIPNATPAPTLRPVPAEDGALRILFLGRVGARKGVPQLIEGLSMIAGRTGWRAIIAGDGEIEESRREIERLGLADRVSLPGWVGPADVAELLSRSDVLVLPSFDENLPMSVIEGMAASLAVIATPVGAVEDIITDGETGLLVPVGDAKAIAVALQRLLDEPELRGRLGQNARKLHAERLEIKAYFDRLVDLWTSLIRQ
ncbi:hypothetical protein ASG42_02030 [Rhizobium sp. Leaf391]|nr:hypothetical protein ASG42_02030 [Rhizobium sp. Leaf391]